MASELISALARVNLAASAAILAVLLLRWPMRALFGARAAYAAWLIVPLAGLGALLPAAKGAPAPMQAIAAALDHASAWASAGASWWLAAWLVGALIAAWLLARRQSRFLAGLGALAADEDETDVFYSAHSGTGPVLVGALRPRIVAPADFHARFDEDERRLILAHERAHKEAGDGVVNALAALGLCVFWFNPLLHVAARRLRGDQELACDADVARAYPGERRRYAETLLKSQLAEADAPLACAWPARGAHPLRERVALLRRAPRRAGFAGSFAVALLGALACFSAWRAQPPSRSVAADPARLAFEREWDLYETDGAVLTVMAPREAIDGTQPALAELVSAVESAAPATHPTGLRRKVRRLLELDAAGLFWR